jgi:hypothetical protein
MNDNDLIEELLANVNYAKCGYAVDDEVMRKAAERLSELTQPQPIETAPVGIQLTVFGGTIRGRIDECEPANVDGVTAIRSSKCAAWEVTASRKVVVKPTHWLPCVKIDTTKLGGKVNEQ